VTGRDRLPCGCDVGFVRCEEGLELWRRMDRLFRLALRKNTEETWDEYEQAAVAVKAHLEVGEAECQETTGSG